MGCSSSTPVATAPIEQSVATASEAEEPVAASAPTEIVTSVDVKKKLTFGEKMRAQKASQKVPLLLVDPPFNPGLLYRLQYQNPDNHALYLT